MYNFCTLFDSFYLSRGLAMYESLKSHLDKFHLYFFAFDDLSLKILKNLNLENSTIISLQEFETPELLEVKPLRTKAEYCWTSTSSTIEYVLNNYNVQNCTYIDADLFFYNSPSVLIDELKDEKTVLISEHRYSMISRLFEEKRAGRFCVQFITFGNDEKSRIVLRRWKDQCIDWCYARYEDGKFGDQKYLDKWPSLYKNVKISENIGGGVAPWNIKQYIFLRGDDKLTGVDIKTGKHFDLIYYHFHFVRFMDNRYVDLGWNVIPKDSLNDLYRNYINTIIKIESDLEKSFNDYKTVYYSTKTSDLKDYVKQMIKTISGFNLFKLATPELR